MNLLTLGDCKASRLPGIAGMCADSAQFIDIVNKASRMLMIRGEFQGLVVKVKVCIDEGCVVWPREVMTVLAVNPCGYNVQVKNGWFEFLANNGGDIRPEACWGTRVMEVDGQVPVFRNIGKLPAYLQVSTVRAKDAGKVITFYGIGEDGNEVMTKRSDGSYLPGLTLALGRESVRSTIKFRKITRIQKDRTTGPIYVFRSELGDWTDLVQVANYAPSDTNPMFRTTMFNTFRQLGCCNCDHNTKSILALVRLQFIAAELDDDVIQIQNIDALEHMIQSIKFSDAFDNESARRWEASAIRELNLELDANQPVEQVSVRVGGFGTALPIYHRIGTMK